MPHQTINWLRLAVGAIILLFCIVPAFAAPPTAETDAKVAGTWQVSAKQGHVRIYEISAGRNVKIVGGGREDRSGRLTPQQDGSYTLKLDDNAIQRLVFVPANDQLLIEHYDYKKNFDLSLPPDWKKPAVRIQTKK